MERHQSRVHMEKMIRDLAEMYPYDVSEVVIVELVANALDAKATEISISYDPHKKILTISDNGKGMGKKDFDKYHDLATNLKQKGDGIGFAGVGAKISFKIAHKVVTYTASSTYRGGSEWVIEDGTLVWYELPCGHELETGTRIGIYFDKDADIAYKRSEDIERLLVNHYYPLFDDVFLSYYASQGIYSSDLRFFLNGAPVKRRCYQDQENIFEHVRELAVKRGPYFGFFAMTKPGKFPVSDSTPGIRYCVYGKVIKSDIHGMYVGERTKNIFGVVEYPALVKHITTAKTDFIRDKRRARKVDRMIQPIVSDFKKWLEEIGVNIPEEKTSREIKRIERELRLLAERIEELEEFVGHFARSKAIVETNAGDIPIEETEGSEATFPDGNGNSVSPSPIPAPGLEDGTAAQETLQEKASARGTPLSRKRRRSPKLLLKNIPERPEMSWIENGAIVINEGNPAFHRIPKSDRHARDLYYITAVANAVQKGINQRTGEYRKDLIDRIMTEWGSISKRRK